MGKKENNREIPSIKKTLFSMSFSIALVVIVLIFVFGFKHFLNGRTYQGKADEKAEAEESFDVDKEYLNIDKNFVAGYIMVKNVPQKGVYASKVPGEKKDDAVSLKDGQILWVSKKGDYEGRTYYRLKNGFYIRANEKYIEELASYEKLGGYVAITYISSTGVRLRKWADFNADNVVKSVYVGDKVAVKGKVTKKNGESAYITESGLYLTTDIQYLNDYTTEPEESSE